jgi:hypothetical protein
MYATNTLMDSFAVDRIAGRSRVTFAIDPLHLHEGRFAVSLAVASHDVSEIYHWLDRRLEFSVFQRATGTGPVDLGGEWTIATGGDADPAAQRPQTLSST